ncbi:MAG TPA: translation initiation factor 2 [Micromonosporaceae bacterium]|nr:translation initiation factor 2 [Micromonosporaceae bacterium]
MSTNGSDDAYWRRPPDNAPTPAQPVQPPSTGPVGYQGPPPSTPPPPDWRPEWVVQVPAARSLPGQDHNVLDAEERSARTLTYGIGLVAGAIMIVLFCALCGRVLF